MELRRGRRTEGRRLHGPFDAILQARQELDNFTMRCLESDIHRGQLGRPYRKTKCHNIRVYAYPLLSMPHYAPQSISIYPSPMPKPQGRWMSQRSPKHSIKYLMASGKSALKLSLERRKTLSTLSGLARIIMLFLSHHKLDSQSSKRIRLCICCTLRPMDTGEYLVQGSGQNIEDYRTKGYGGLT